MCECTVSLASVDLVSQYCNIEENKTRGQDFPLHVIFEIDFEANLYLFTDFAAGKPSVKKGLESHELKSCH